VNFDLFVNVVESEDGLVIDCDYNTDLFDEATVAQWMKCYQTLLDGIAEDPRRPLVELPLLRGQELEAVHAGNNTRADYPSQKTIHQLFEEQAARTPDAVALEFEGCQLSYFQLEKKANQLAAYLRKLGVGQDTLVGLLAERSTEMVIGLLGVLKAGGAYVPMDPTYPKDRIAFILNETKTPVLLTLQRLAGQVDAGAAQVVCLDADWLSIESEADSPGDSGVKPENLAYVIYTSGSTGQPKGVEISHRSVVNLLCAMQKAPGLTEKDTLLAVTTLSFDIAGLELYLPLITGARLVVATRETASDGTQLLAKMRNVGATVLQATPITWRLLLEAGWKGDPQLTVLCGGEALPRDLADQLLATGCPLWNMYGPTETTIWSSALRVQPGQGPVPLGPPIANTQFYVLDSGGQPVPTGVPGELHIGGDGLARGYFQRPQLTAEKFVPNPFHQGSNARLYKTGDLVRSRPDGTLEFLGRLDHQVKLRGFRVELGEIESILVQHPKASEAVVVIREDRPGEKRVISYLVTSDGAPPDSSELRSFLASRLPDYMIPAAFVHLAVMPLTDNGKINRRALPAPDWKNPVRTKEFVAPRTEQEQTLAKIWAEVLHLERVSTNDNIFELGADSLHMFQIAARANKAGLHVTPRLLLQHRTIAAVVAGMGTNGNGNGNGNGAKPVAPTITPVSRERFRIKARQGKT
jgi:amino acid adenylation domain-containing protein